MIKIKREYKKYIRLVAGILILILGVIFVLIPFIPLGYIFLIAGLILLAYYVPFLKKIVEKIKQKDDKGRVDRVEEKIDDGEKKINKKFVESDFKNQTDA